MSTFEGDLKQAIIRVSLQVGAELGEEGLTMRGIASRLGVSATALYQHFASKASILHSIRLHGLEILATRLRCEGANPLEALQVFGRRYVDFARENPWLYSILFGRESIDVDQLSTDERVVAEVPYRIFREHCERAVAEGAMSQDADPRLSAMVLWASLHGLALLLIEGRIRRDHPLHPIPDDEAFVDTFIHCIIKTLESQQFVQPRAEASAQRSKSMA